MEVAKCASGLSNQFGEILCQQYFGNTSPPVFGERHREFWDILRENEIFTQDLFKHVPSVEKLYLADAQLSKSDIQSLTKTIKAGKLPQLKYLNISYNDLGHMEREVEALIATHDARGEKQLKLRLWRTELSEKFKKRCEDKYRRVEIPSAERLNFSDVQLSKADIQSISRAIKDKELPQPKELDLCNNTLTGCLTDLFGGSDHPGFYRLEKLNLWETHLNLEDVRSLGEAVRAEKLPRLKEVILSGMEKEIEGLIAACDAHCEKRLKLWLLVSKLSWEFKQKCRDMYHNVDIYGG